mmetsp:Transcript_750/g.1115  ORF Transcript_750/g.1115 Transcript_750/m.1115 type:complete len:482 (+) Transcript_750:87-1532(+)
MADGATTPNSCKLDLSKSKNNDDGSPKEKKLKPWPNDFRLMDIGIVSCVLIVGIIIAVVVIFTQKEPQEPQRPTTQLFDVLKNSANFLPESYEDIIATTEDNTPQERAADWVIHKDTRKVVSAFDKWFIVRYVLATLFYSTGGETSWMDKTGWLQDENTCEWKGVECVGNTSVERIVGVEQFVELDLNRNGLEGKIPEEVALLDNLKSVFLNNNKLNGTIPAEFGNMTLLEVIHLQKNELTGDMPASLIDLTTEPGVLTDILSDCGDSGLIQCEDCEDLWCASTRKDAIFNKLLYETTALPESVDNYYSLVERGIPTLPDDYAAIIDTMDSNTPQERAADWLLHKDPRPLNTPDDKWLLVRYALATLFFSTGGETSWVDKSNWLEHEDTCKWKGVRCSGNSTLVENFESLTLTNNNLTGEITPDFGLLDEVKFVYMNDNELTGTIPPELGGMLSAREFGHKCDKKTFDDHLAWKRIIPAST